MPVRHEGDYQRKPIKSWDSWVDEAIQEAQQRGEFDNLPLQGKPIRIEETPFAPDLAAALRTLKNAGYAPTWMELDREITQGKEEMARFLDRSVAYLRQKQSELASGETVTTPVPQPPHIGLWSRIKQLFSFASESTVPPGTSSPSTTSS